MKKGTKWFLGIVAGLILFVIIAVMLAGSLPSNSVLVLKLSGSLPERRPSEAAAALFGPKITLLHEYTDAIDHAARDSRISGLVLRITSLNAGWGRIQEVHSRLLAFRKSGKTSICYLNDDIIGNPEYFLATGCDQVWVVPTSTVGITGMMAEATFLRGSLDKLRIYPDFYGIAEFKTARDQLTEKKFTAANREMTTSILTSIYETFLTGVADARKLDRAEFAALVQKGPYLQDDAVKHKFIDRAAFWDEVKSFFEEKLKTWKPVELSSYRDEIGFSSLDSIAIVHATGAIVMGGSGEDPVFGELMGADAVSADLRAAREDDSVKAIVLRVDSPGGSAVASEVIRREVQLAREKKPVVVSMSNLAASGGYWISMSADKIIAEPSTLTGSIGVVFGKFNLSGLYDMLGLSTDRVATSDNATFLSSQQNFTPAQREAVQKFMQDIYANFTKGVAEGRSMDLAKVEKIARGRVWTGQQALDLGLVDELGDENRAVTLAQQLAKIPAEELLRRVRYPQEKSFWELVGEIGNTRAVRSPSIADSLERLKNAETPIEVRMPFEIRIR